MKKRITCLLLTLIMLVSLVPVTSLTASAASLSVSEAAITVLKKMTLFKSKCYQVAKTQEFRIGYGTVCNEKGHNIGADGKVIDGKETEEHKISQADADKALRNALKEIDKKVNSFASSNGLSLKQNQHDALVIFSFDSGTAWMDGNGVVKTAIVNKVSANELLNAMNEWTKMNDLNRRKVEVNMYMNNVYSNVVPSSYSQVTYDPNGGVMAQHNDGSTYIMQFDTTKTVSHTPLPTKNGCTFLGWYINGSVWSPSLTADCSGKILKAVWQNNGLAAKDAEKNPQVAYTLAKSKLASRTIYNIPNVKDGKETGKVESNNVTIDRDYIGSDGTRWARIKNSGWVIVKAGSNGISSGGTDIDVTVTVTNSYVNSRVNATIHSATNGSYQQGAQLRIINTAQADGFLWGQVAKSADDDTPICWVALMYTNWNSVKDQGTSENGSSANSKAIAKATVTNNGYVNVRSDAGTDNKIVGALAKNETVEVYEIKTVNGHQWGRTTAGWFCMTYASVTMLTTNSSNNIISDAGALDYAFTGKMSKDVKPQVQAGENTNYTGDTVKQGTSVTLTNMVVVGEQTWGKIVWRVDTDKDGKADTNKTGWIQVDNPLKANGDYLSIDAARFQVVSDTKVRETADNGGNAVFTITPGVEFEAVEIELVGENIWGQTDEFKFVENTGNTENGTANYNGWVNLASKYVKRVNAPTIEGDKTNHNTGKVATVINTDSVRVRNTGATYGTVTGSLSRGTTVKVWDENEDGWYKVDSNKNGTFEDESDGWVYGQYLEVTDAPAGTSSDGSTSNGTPAASSSGTGIVANTYSGVNVRASAGIGGAFVCKLLPGTQVEILETKTVGAAKWGRVAQGWVCMDYIAMISYDDIPGGNTGNNSGTTPNGTAVDSLDNVDKTTTTAVYTGKIKSDVSGEVNVYAEPALKTTKLEEREIVRTLKANDPITMYELVTVTETYEEKDEDIKVNEDEESGNKQGGGTKTTYTVTSYWARVNGGYIYDPEHNLTLDALDEKVHTLTGSDTLNVRSAADNGEIIDKLEKGDQVSVTALEIVNDKVWGRIQLDDNADCNYGWIRLDYMSEGAYYVNQNTTNNNNNTAAPSAPVIGSTGNTGTGGVVNNTSGYKYTGKVIRNGSTPLKVRSTASAGGTVTTTLANGASLVIYETTIADGMIWGRCDAGWVYLYYVDLTPSGGSAIDAQVVYTEGTVIYTDSDCSEVAGTYSRMSLVDIYEIVGKMARTDLGWVNTDNLG